MTRPILAALLMLLVAATAASAADRAVATAPSDDTDAQIAAWLADGDTPSSNQAMDATLAASAPRAVHGEASLTVGSHGLRAASLAAVMPIGETGSLGVAVQDARWGGRRGGESRSLAISLNLGDGARLEPCGVVHTGQQLASDLARNRRCAGAGAPFVDAAATP